MLEVNWITFEKLDAVVDDIPGAPPAEWLGQFGEAYVGFLMGRRDVWCELFEGQRETASFPLRYTDPIGRLIRRIAEPPEHLGAAEDSRPLAEQLFVSVHGAVAPAAIERIDMVRARGARTLAREAVETTVRAIEVRRE